MNVLLVIHSINRWIILAIAIVTLARLVSARARSRSPVAADLTWLRVYTADLGLQVLIGLAYLIATGLGGVGFPRYRMEHAVIMLLAVAAGGVAQVLTKRGGRARSALSSGPALWAMVVSLALIVIGVSLLPGGWRR